MFLLTDALLILLDDITNGLVVFPAMIKSQMEQKFSSIITETIVMKLVHWGISRQDAHQCIPVFSRETVHAVKMEGGKNDLIEWIKKDDFFVSFTFGLGVIMLRSWPSQKPFWDDLDSLLDPKLFIGSSAEIVERYFGASGPVTTQLEKYRNYITSTATATVHI